MKCSLEKYWTSYDTNTIVHCFMVLFCCIWSYELLVLAMFFIYITVMPVML